MSNGTNSSGVGKGGGGNSYLQMMQAKIQAEKDALKEADIPAEQFPDAFIIPKNTFGMQRKKAWWDHCDEYGEDVSADDAKIIYDSAHGYVSTSNSFDINRKLYDPDNAGKTPEQIFKNEKDLKTVQTLDRLIDNHATPKDAAYTRYCESDSVEALFELSNEQLARIDKLQAWSEQGADISAEVKDLNNALSGTIGRSASYTSTSTDPHVNVFKSRDFVRKINVAKGTKALALAQQDDESEVVFGRGMRTRLDKVTIENGKMYLWETFLGYD